MCSCDVGPTDVGNHLAMARGPATWQRRWMLALIGVLVVVALALLGGGAAYALPRLLQTSAQVTITPRSGEVKASYTLSAVPGVPDAAKQQVGARMVSVTTPAETRTVPATGSKTIPGTHARGTVGVLNYDTAHPLRLPAGTTFPNAPGCVAGYGSLVMVLDAAVSLPASPSSDETNAPSVTVPAHVQQVGPIGNYPLLTLPAVTVAPRSGCAFFVYLGGSCSDVYNVCLDVYSTSSFTGGTNAKTETTVAQSDIDGTAQSLIQTTQPDAGQVVQRQLQPNERLAGTPQCASRVGADHQAGDVATSVTVSVSFTCSGQAYDDAGARALVARLLQDQAVQAPGAGYVLVGQIKMTLLSATPGAQGAVQLVVSAEGLWAYQFSAAQQQALARLIAGKSTPEAQRILTAQPGVSQAAITLSGGQTLPVDPSKIIIAIWPISGF